MKRYLLLLLTLVCFVSCNSPIQPKGDIHNIFLNTVVPPNSTNLKYTGKVGWYTFDRGEKHYIMYYYWTILLDSSDTFMIIEDSTPPSSNEIAINNPDNHRFYDIITTKDHNVYFNKETFRVECKEYDDIKDSYFVRVYIQYKIDSDNDVVHLEVLDTTSMKNLYSYAKNKVILKLNQEW